MAVHVWAAADFADLFALGVLGPLCAVTGEGTQPAQTPRQIGGARTWTCGATRLRADLGGA
eukprot:4678089-Prymnesium_polylepis.2